MNSIEPFLNPAQTVEDLRKAADYLAAHPWGQGHDYRDDTKAVCAFGAIRTVIGGLVVDPRAEYGYRDIDIPSRYPVDSAEATQALRLRTRASNASRAFYRVIGSDITAYNDVEGRTKEQMIRAMQTVASAIEEDPRRA